MNTRKTRLLFEWDEVPWLGQHGTLPPVPNENLASTLGSSQALWALPDRWQNSSVELPDYKLERVVGAGAMGVVFEAFDKRTSQRVAIKTLATRDAEALRGLKREFRTVADLVHPNLAQAFELAFDENVPYLVMEFIDGVDFLRHVTEPGGRCNVPRLRDALLQLVRGVEALHRAGYSHLDLKPANVLVERGGRVVVLDFGLAEGPPAKAGGALSLRGTPEYMAPEQCSGVAEQPADAYAVGVMLFEALTGSLPFAVTDMASLLQKQRLDAPRVASLAPDAPLELAELCDALLRRKPEARPTLTQVSQRLTRESMVVANSSQPKPSLRPFVGRRAELELLRQAFRDSGARAVHFYLSGASGLGKTTLLRHFLTELGESGPVLVLAGRCFERESVPYKAVDGVIDALGAHVRELLDEVEERAELLRVFPALAGELRAEAPVAAIDPHELRQRAFRGLRKLFAKLATQVRVVVAVDDLQWGDLDSARLFRHVFGSPEAPPALVLGAYRADDGVRSPFLAEWFKNDGSADVRHLALGPLKQEEACDLARQLLRDAERGDGETVVQNVARECGGNPFFVDSLLAYRELTQRTGATSLREVIGGFLAELNDEGRRIVRLLAVAAEPLPQGVTLEAANVRVERHAVFAKLRSLRLVRTSGVRDSDRVELYHDRIREIVQQNLAPTELRAIHEALADALSRSDGCEPEQLAHHYHAAGRLIDAGHYALLSAQRADGLLAFERAANLFRLAVECRPDDVALRVRFAEALERAGRCTDAAHVFLECAAAASGAQAAALERGAARQLLFAGRVQDGLSLLRPHLKRLDLDLPATPRTVKWRIARELVRVRVGSAHLAQASHAEVEPALLARIDAGISAVDGLTGGDPMLAASLMLQTLRLALKAREPARVAWGLAQFGLLRSSGGSDKAVAAGEELLVKAELLSRKVKDPELEVTLLVARSRAALATGDFVRALATAEACIQLFRGRSLKNSGLVAVAHNVSLFALDALGRLHQLRERAHARLLMAEAVGDLYSEVTARTYAAVAALGLDDPTLGEQLLADAAKHFPSGTVLFQSWLLLRAQAMLDLYAGRPGAAWTRIEREWPLLERAHLLRVQFIRIFALRLRATAAVAALAKGELKGSGAAFALRDASALERERRPFARAAASAVRGGLAAARGDGESAALEYTRAAAAYDEAAMPLEAACCRLRWAGIEGNAQARTEASRQLRALGVKSPTQFAAIHSL